LEKLGFWAARVTYLVFDDQWSRDKILNLKKRIAADKWRHFYVGIPMGIVLQMLARWLYQPPLIYAVLLALAGVIAISYGFELFSKITRIGVYDFMDAVASIIGGVIGMGIVLTSLWLFVN
jgi:glycopeptide antibiotics resistance protein